MPRKREDPPKTVQTEDEQPRTPRNDGPIIVSRQQFNDFAMI